MSQSHARLAPAALHPSSDEGSSAAALRTVAVVDDDDSIRFLVETLLERDGLRAVSYPTAEAFLEGCDRESTGCLVLDLQLPGMNGLKLQDVLAQEGSFIPILFFTARGTVPDAVRALKNGAVDFVEKPFDNKELLAKIRYSLAAGARVQERLAAASAARSAELLASLTAREREVMERVVAGHLNKRIADDLGICIKTVEYHRARVMQKTGVRSVAQLVQLALQSG
jgi:FixJ family two-component response regulator